MLTLNQTDGLDIPDFLRVKPEDMPERKRRNEEWARLHPPLADVERKAMVERHAAEAAERKRLKTEELNALRERKKLERAAESRGAFQKALPGTRWDPSISKFVPINAPAVNPSKYIALLKSGAVECPATVTTTPPRAERSATTTPTPMPSKVVRTSNAGAKRPATTSPTVSKPASEPRAKSTLGKSGMKPEVEAKLLAFMRTPRTMEAIGNEMGWLKHSASARVSGLKKAGHVVVKADGLYSVTA